MTLHDHRARFEDQLSPIVNWCMAHDVSPNVVSVVALVITSAAGVVFWQSTPARWWLLPVGAFLLLFGAMLDSADGLLARATDQASALGDFLDHAFDRFADVALLVGLTFSPWVPFEIGLFAIVGTLLTSYMGTQAQAVGVGRDYGGLVGRADRMFVLFCGAIGQAVVVPLAVSLPLGLNLVEVAVGWIALAGNITALQRFWGALAALRDERTKPK
ncbi:CDP-alcohol phosphatidyltransferase family protein [Thermoplasmatales archaeon SW_10_69_26]|nr:MAG: CDP-alcohol phosphatidyltransferase family protein [Thermoplasmatales archaeon SW_10_69_26]